MRIGFRAFAVLFVLAGLVLGACAPSTPSAQPTQPPASTTVATTAPMATPTQSPAEAPTAKPVPRNITIAVGTYTLDVTYPYLNMPIALGYWEDLGYKVNVQAVGASMDALQLVVAGKADFAMCDASVIVQANVKEGIPMRDVMESDSVDYAIVVPADSPIQTVQDLEGKKIGVFSLASGSIPLLQSYLRDSGIDPDNDVQMIAVGYGPQASQALKRGDVDCLVLWNAALATLENLGHEFRYLRAESWIDMPGFVLSTTQDKIDKDRDMVVSIVKGMVMALEYTLANPECVVRLQWESWPDTKPQDMTDEAAMAWDMHLLEAQFELMLSTYEKHGSNLWAIALPEEYDTLQKFLLNAGQIDGTLDPSTYVVTDQSFYADVNDFDHQAIKQQAANCPVE